MQIDERQFHEVIKKSRLDHLWKKDGKEWKLKNLFGKMINLIFIFKNYFTLKAIVIN